MAGSLPGTPSASQPDYHPVIQNFLQWTRSNTTRRIGRGGPDNDDKREYISYKALEKRLDRRAVDQLLDALFQDADYPRPDRDSIMKHHLRSFAILLSIGEGHMIHHFTRYQNLQDPHLPFPKDEPPDFPKSNRRDIYSAFRREQWAFCAVTLEYNFGLNLDADAILPIEYIEQLQEGGSAVVYKVRVDKDYDQLTPLAGESLNPDDQQWNTYVIKSYRTTDAEDYYNAEFSAFQKLRYNGRPPSNIIEFYGHFQREGTYNIILEYADLGTLEDYMQKTPPPFTVGEKMVFWSNFLNVGHGLLTIHGEEENHKDAPQILLGWHQDINPWNILVKSRKGRSVYDCDFKLADLGLSHFKKHVPSARRPTDTDTWGTTAYGAPEARRANGNLERTRLQVRQDIDIWSMGCVYSEVVTWVDQGKNKLTEYRRRRSEETKFWTNEKEDCFHDGFEVLPAVNQAHLDVTENRRVNDRLTSRVVEELVKEMLQVKGNRPSAKNICDRSWRIVNEADGWLKQIPNLPLPPTDRLRAPPGEISTFTQTHSPQISEGSLSEPPGSAERWQRNSDQFHDEQGLYQNRPPVSGISQSYNTTAHSGRFSSQRYDSSDVFSDHPAKGIGAQANRGDRQPDRSVTYPDTLANQFQVKPNSSVDAMKLARPPINHISSAERVSSENNSTWTDRQRQSPPVVEFESFNLDEAPPASGVSRDEASEWKGRSNTRQYSPKSESPTRVEPRQGKSRNAMPIPEMTVDEGLEVKKQREYGKRVHFSSDEQEDRKLLEPLRGRDQAFLIDNSKSMEAFRPQLRRVLELLSYMLTPLDPDGLDLYFASQAKKSTFKGCYAALAEFDRHQSSPMADIRQRFANILEEYQGKYGKRNYIGKIRHPRSLPSKGPRKFTLYVLTDGAWWDHVTLVDEVKSLVRHITTNNIPNKHVGIQFIRFGNDKVGMAKLARLDSRLRLGVDLDLVDTVSADGNVYKMLLGPLHPAIDGDLDEENHDYNDDGRDDNGHAKNTSVKGKERLRQ